MDFIREIRSDRLKKAAISGLLTGLLGIFAVTFAGGLEEDFGLKILFKLRAESPVPEEVVVVALDKQSADRLGLPRVIREWPRSYHAQLVQKLKNEGAVVIAFDIFFKKNRENDALLADAIKSAGNVVLIESIKREPPKDVSGRMKLEMVQETVVPPTEAIARSALSLAPFPLPKVPGRVNQFWTFKNETGDLPTLPVAVFQIFGLQMFDEMVSLFEKVLNDPLVTKSVESDIDVFSIKLVKRLAGLKRAEMTDNKKLAELIRNLKEILGNRTPLSKRIMEVVNHPSEDYSERLKALLKMYRGGNSRYLNFYGPPGTINTVPFYQALQSPVGGGEKDPSVDFNGKVVFIGVSDTIPDSERKDDFTTVFSQPTGLDLSGVEIAATAFSNLLEDRSIHPLSYPFQIITVLFWGGGIGMLWFWLPLSRAILYTVVASLLFTGFVYSQFKIAGIWFPMIIPIFFQIPVAAFGAVSWHWTDVKRERKQIEERLKPYLPPEVADRLIDRTVELIKVKRLVYATILYSDIENYTALSESMRPAHLAALMSDYYETIFSPVERFGGMALSMKGDSMLAIWIPPEHRQDTGRLRKNACLAALEMRNALDRFNQNAAHSVLRTRVGLHYGEIFLGDLGGAHRLEYTAIGDIPSTASRIEGLNKKLKTCLLVSSEVLEGLDGFLTRELGDFLFVGKSKPLAIHELIAPASECTVGQMGLCRDFCEALDLYRSHQWKAAGERFSKLLGKHRGDGPSRYYQEICRRLCDAPPEEPWDRTIRLTTK